MSESLVHVPLWCPACGTRLDINGDRRLCSRCGRAFNVVVKEAGPGGVYREAPADLVPAHDRQPLVGLRDEGKKGQLDVLLSGRWLVSRALLLPFYLVTAVLVLADLGVLQIASWAAVLTIPVVADYVLMAFGVRDRLVVEGSSLVCQRRRERKVYFEERVQLSHITGVHDAGDYVRIGLDDGTIWHVGEGLKVPRRVIRWVAQRVAQLLPMPTIETHPAALAERSETGREEGRQPCPDETCIGVIGAEGRCEVCGHAA
jgi:hypothetical protein